MEYTLEIQKDMYLDIINRTVIQYENVYQLTNTEFKILFMLVDNCQDVVTRKEFCNYVQKDKKNYRVIDVYIVKLRNKLTLNNLITIRGKGYMLL